MFWSHCTLGAGTKTRLHTPKAVTYHEQPHYCRSMIGHSLGRMESRIKEFTPHCVCRPQSTRSTPAIRSRQYRLMHKNAREHTKVGSLSSASRAVPVCSRTMRMTAACVCSRTRCSTQPTSPPVQRGGPAPLYLGHLSTKGRVCGDPKAPARHPTTNPRPSHWTTICCGSGTRRPNGTCLPSKASA